MTVPNPTLLPLKWLRLPLLLATLGLSGVCIAVAAQAIRGISQLQRDAKIFAMENCSASFTFDTQDIRSVTDILLTVASLLSLASVFSAILLAYDWIATLVKQHASRALPISTRTLKMQSIILMVLTIWLFAILIPSTVFSRTRSARTDESTCTTHDLPIQANPVYWNHGFLRCLAAAPWFSFVFALPATIITICAWRMSIQIDRLTDIKASAFSVSQH